MDEHSPISCSIVARVCASTQETGECFILFHSRAAGIARVAETRAMNWPPCDYCSALARLALASIREHLKLYSGAMHDLAQERL